MGLKKNSREAFFDILRKFKHEDIYDNLRPFEEVYQKHNDRMRAEYREGKMKKEDLRWK